MLSHKLVMHPLSKQSRGPERCRFPVEDSVTDQSSTCLCGRGTLIYSWGGGEGGALQMHTSLAVHEYGKPCRFIVSMLLDVY